MDYVGGSGNGKVNETGCWKQIEVGNVEGRRVVRDDVGTGIQHARERTHLNFVADGTADDRDVKTVRVAVLPVGPVKDTVNERLVKGDVEPFPGGQPPRGNWGRREAKPQPHRFERGWSTFHRHETRRHA